MNHQLSDSPPSSTTFNHHQPSLTINWPLMNHQWTTTGASSLVASWGSQEPRHPKATREARSGARWMVGGWWMVAIPGWVGGLVGGYWLSLGSIIKANVRWMVDWMWLVHGSWFNGWQRDIMAMMVKMNRWFKMIIDVVLMASNNGQGMV